MPTGPTPLTAHPLALPIPPASGTSGAGERCWGWRQQAAAMLALASISVCAYWGVWRYSFVNFDDGLYVAENPHVTSGLTTANFRWACSSLQGANWHPLTWLSFQVDASLFGPAARGFHLTNLLLHVLNSLLLWQLSRRFWRSFWPGTLVAALFAAHPQHVESVAWVSERKDVLSIFFGLLALIGYCRYVERPSVGRYLAVTLAFLASLLAKTMLVTLPFLLLVFDWWPLRRLAAPAGNAGSGRRVSIGRLLGEKVLWFTIAIGSCAVAVFAQRAGSALRDLEDFGPAYRLSNAAAAYVFYIVKAVCPTGLIAFYPAPDSYPTGETALRVASLLSITAVAAALRRSRPYVLFGWLWFLGTLVPVIGLVQVGWQAYADRYSYFPQIGLLIIIAGAIEEISRARPAGRAAAVLLSVGAVAACLGLTCKQRECWRDSRSLWEHTLAVTPDNFCAHRFMADLLTSEGRLNEAIQHSRAAAAAKPVRNLYVHLAQLLVQAGEYDEAIEAYQNAVRKRANDAESHFLLGDLLLKRNRPAEAAEHYVEALAWEPGWAEAYNGLATAQSQLGRHQLAVEAYAAAVSADPGNALFRKNLQLELTRTGRSAE